MKVSWVAFESTSFLFQQTDDSAAPEWHVKRPVPSRVAFVLERSLNWKGFDSWAVVRRAEIRIMRI